MAYTLHVGEKNYSSWSARPWILMRGAGIPFAERLVSLRADAEKATRFGHLPAGRVPALEDDGFLVWDSLAITEYLAERHPGVWPVDARARAWARSICAEMHSGFGALRSEMAMDVRARRPQRRRSAAVLADIGRVVELWTETRRRFGASGPLLFGGFTAADAFYAPVCSRLRTYAPPISNAAAAYVERIHALPSMRAWCDAARAEHDFIAEDEPYRSRA
jgi:glutathione S-transferase